MKIITDGNGACSKVAYYFSEVCSIYPITPSSPMASNIDKLTSTDLLNIFNDKPKVLEMESEAGAAGSDRSCDGDAGDLPFFLFYEFAFSSAQHVRNRGTVWFRSKYYEL